jgi:RimJ/RimL family protein N-acetyltransferase
MRLERLDPARDRDFLAWFETFDRSSRAELPDSDTWKPEEWRARCGDDTTARSWHLLVDADTMPHPVAVAGCEITRLDNLTWARGELHVDPDHRRRGHGTAALASLEAYVAALGRRELVIMSEEGPAGRPLSASRAFASARGYELAEEMVLMTMDWPAVREHLNRVRENFTGSGDRYDIECWRGGVPERWLADRAHLAAVMPLEAPHTGDQVTQEVWDAGRVREHEVEVSSMSRDLFIGGAIDRRDGRLVGFTELTVPLRPDAVAYQWDTIVLRAHRGHRLGGLMKLAVLTELSAADVAVSQIKTFNDVTNSWMIEVNRRLGAEPSGHRMKWRRQFEAVS